MKFRQFLSRLSKGERTLLYVAVVIVCVGSIERVVYRPIMSRFNELDQEILLKENQVRRNLRNIVAREAILNGYVAYAGVRVTAGSDEEEIGGVLDEIEGLARKSGVSLVKMQPKPVNRIDVGKEYPVELEVETRMVALLRFLRGLQSSPHLVRVKELRLTDGGRRGSRVKGYLLIKKIVIP